MCNVVYYLATRNLDKPRKDEFDRNLLKDARAHEKVWAELRRMGTAKVGPGAPIAVPGVVKMGRWHRQAPPGWDDQQVSRDALAVAKRVGGG